MPKGGKFRPYIPQKSNRPHIGGNKDTQSHTTYNKKFHQAYSLVEMSINAYSVAEQVETPERAYVDRLAGGWAMTSCMGLEYAYKQHLSENPDWMEEIPDTNSGRRTHKIEKLDEWLSIYNPELHSRLLKHMENNKHLLDIKNYNHEEILKDLVYFQPDYRYYGFEDGDLVSENPSIIIFLVFFQGTLEEGIARRISKKEEILKISSINKEAP